MSTSVLVRPQASEVAGVAEQVLVYLRISEDRTGEEAGVERQRDDCLGLCHRLSLEVADGDVFMDNDTYEQFMVSPEIVGDAAKFLLDGATAQITMHESEALQVELPGSVVLEITYTEPGLQGDRSSAGTKPATVETGAEIQVPLFVEQGTRVKINPADGSYLGRVTD